MDPQDLKELVNELEVALDLIFASEGVEHKIFKHCLKDPVECTDCKGSGEYIGFSAIEKCKLCKGFGQIEREI